jgi:hypothetical protein
MKALATVVATPAPASPSDGAPNAPNMKAQATAILSGSASRPMTRTQRGRSSADRNERSTTEPRKGRKAHCSVRT